MPNLTAVLEGEDAPTVEELAKSVCIALDGTGAVPAGIFITYDVDNIDGGGFEWTAPNGTWINQVLSAAGGYQLSFDGDAIPIKFEVTENAHRFTSNVNGLYLDNERVLVSDTSITAGSDAITNIVSLLQAEYNGIGTKGPTTLYIVTDTPKIYLGDTVIL